MDSRPGREEEQLVLGIGISCEPTRDALGAAEEEELGQDWQGKGY